MVAESLLEISSIRRGDSVYDAADDVSVGYDGHGHPDQADPGDGTVNQGIQQFDPDEGAADEFGDAAEHVAEKMIAGGDEFAAVVVPFDDGDSSSQAGSQAVDSGEYKVLSHRG